MFEFQFHSWICNPPDPTDLAEIHKTVKSSKRGNRSWQLLGEIVSDKCLAALLGIRSQRLRTAGSGKLDMRYGCFGAVPRLHLFCEGFMSFPHTHTLSLSLSFPVAIHHIPNQLSLIEAKKRTPLKNMKLDQFFLKLYVEQGGMLPNKLLVMLWG